MVLESLTNEENQREPFTFWLVRLILPADEGSEDGFQPISNREFYAMSALILTAYALYALFLGPLGV